MRGENSFFASLHGPMILTDEKNGLCLNGAIRTILFQIRASRVADQRDDSARKTRIPFTTHFESDARTADVQKHLVIVNGVAIAIFVIRDESVSGCKFTLPILIAVTGFIAMPQEKAQTVTGNTVLKASDLSGAEMYRTYCASCHGIDGKGSGPAAAALKKTPPDLTQLAKHNNGHLPDFRILRIIDGDEIKAAHGSRDMPIWRDYFRLKQRDEGIVAVREHNLVEYIRSIQQR